MTCTVSAPVDPDLSLLSDAARPSGGEPAAGSLPLAVGACSLAVRDAGALVTVWPLRWPVARYASRVVSIDEHHDLAIADEIADSWYVRSFSVRDDTLISKQWFSPPIAPAYSADCTVITGITPFGSLPPVASFCEL